MPKGGGKGISMNNGGIMGSGIFGMFGTTVQCKSDDKSLFCTLSKIVNVIIMIMFLIFILYLVYMIFKYFFGGNSSGHKMTGGYIPGSKSRGRSKKSKYLS